MTLLRTYRADLHIHSCLSPCAEWEMSPRRIVSESSRIGLDIIAVCDHNSAENAAPAMKIGRKHGITVLPGLEICSREEVHMLAIFPELESAAAMQEFVYRFLPGENQPDLFGFQVIANEKDEVIAENPRLLIGATTLGLQEISEKTHEFGGLSIAAHIDRPAFGLIGQLGFIPDNIQLDALEVSYRIELNSVVSSIPQAKGYACITSSDAHRLSDIGRAETAMRLSGPTFAEVRKCLHNFDQRKILL